jgi:CRISPR-associated protein Cst2
MNKKAISAVWLVKTDLTNLNSGVGGAQLVDVKKYKKDGAEYPYVSGQAMRYYLKQAIRRAIDPKDCCVPDSEGEGCGDIKKCVLCDLFGFMRPKEFNRRTSPIKMSPAMGLLPLQDNLTLDFLTRTKPQTKGEELRGDIVNVELGVNIYKAGFAIDLVKVGGEEEIDFKAQHSNGIKYFIEEGTRKNRIRVALEALKNLADYSKQARLLTDFTPEILLIGLQDRYNHILQKALELIAGTKEINVERLDQVLTELKGEKNYAGILSGAINNEKELKEMLKKHNISITTPTEAIDRVINEVSQI